MSAVSSVRFKNLLRISVPLMLIAASESLMMFMDRVFLARYDLGAMNSAAATFMSTALVIFSIVAICAISEVLAGQYNGQKKFYEVSRPVWQMVWFGLFMSVVTVPLAFYAKGYFISSNLHFASGHYYEIIMCFAGFWGVNVALAGFFAAIGRPEIVTVSAIVANIVNITLNYVLIFGMGPVPSLGIDGAAWATVIGQLSQFVILLYLFLQKPNRQKYHSHKLKWNTKDLVRCFKIGTPNALSHGVEIFAWALLYRMVSGISFDYITVITVSHSLLILFSFLNDGLKQGVVAMASNIIGAGRSHEIPKLLILGCCFQLLIAGVLAVPMLLLPHFALEILGDFNEHKHLIEFLILGIRLSWLFVLFDGLVWVVNGVLTAGGDTRVPMVINIVTSWGVVILPVWYFIVLNDGGLGLLQVFPAVYAFINFTLHYLRYKQGRWQVQLTA